MTIEIDFRNRLNEEFLTESDRGCAILTVCLLEEALHDVFAKVLPNGKESARDFMPPGRLSLGVRNAAALGLLSEPELSNIKLILKIRNAFAHKLLDGLKFDSPEIKKYTLELTLPNLDGVTAAYKLQIKSIPRERYMVVFGFVIGALDRIAHIASPLPVYKSLPTSIVEV